jgi:hypothetical protein
VLINLSGRGDKDIGTVADLSGTDFYDRPSMRGLSVKGAQGGAVPSPPQAGPAPSGGSAARATASVGVNKS